MKVTIHYAEHSTEATVTKMRRVTPTWYAVGEHFGMQLHEDQRLDSPDFDPESPIKWEFQHEGT
jgi:hypothetical protein